MDTLEIAQKLYKSQSKEKKKIRETSKKALLGCKDIKLYWIEQNDKFIHHGDEVIVKLKGDLLVGPYEVLGFTSDGKKIYMDKNCYWIPEPIENVAVVLTKLK